jgi:plasmid stability protein
VALNLSIKNVPEPLADKLRARAERNHRSLQGELMAIIESAVANEGLPQEAVHGREAIRRGTKTIEQIAAELRAKHPEPITVGPRSVDIIRELRDSR